MSTLQAPASESSGAGSPWVARAVVAVLLLLLAGIALLVYLASESGVERGALDPDSPTPEGARALAVLLERRDHPVREVERPGDDLDEALRDAARGDVTVVVPFSYNLSQRTIERLAGLPASARVVFLAPDPVTVAELSVGARITDSPTVGVAAPGCDLPEAVSAGDARLDSRSYVLDQDSDGAAGVTATSCYRGGLLLLDRPDNAQLVLLGNQRFLTNDRLADHGHAALALGLLTDHRDVLWLTITTLEADAEGERAGDGGVRGALSDLLPGWVGAVTLLLALTAVLAAFWRGRRLGLPVAEPLPVIVRSAETAEGRARLYRRAHARAEAVEALRGSALARLLPVLGLGPTPDPRAVAESVADRSGWPTATVAGLLYGPTPADDRALVEAATALDALVTAVVSPRPTAPPETPAPAPASPAPASPDPTPPATSRSDEGPRS